MSESSLKANTVLNILRSVLGLLFPLITFKYASVILGPTGIGAANYAQSIITYFQLLATFGITSYAIAEGAKLRKEPERFGRFANEIYTINLLSTLFSYLILLILSVGGVFGHHNIYIIILSATLFFSLIGVEWMFVIYEQFKYITLRSLFFQIVSFALLFVFVKTENDTAEYVGLIALSTVGSSIFNFYKSRQICKVGLAPLRDIKRHLTPLFIIFGTSIASLIYVNSDMILLGVIKSDVEVGIYAAGVKVSKAICVPIASVSLVAVPRISEKIAQSSLVNVEEICRKVLHFMCFFIFPFGVGLFLLSDESILLLSGADFLDGSVVIKILIIDLFLSPVNGFLVSQLLIPFGKEKISLYATIGGAIGNILLDILLIPLISIYGAACATVFSELIVFLMCMPFLNKQLNLYEISKGCWQYFVGSLLIIPVFFIFHQATPNYIINSLLIIIIAGCIYIFTLIKMNNIVVKEISQLLRSKLHFHHKL